MLIADNGILQSLYFLKKSGQIRWKKAWNSFAAMKFEHSLIYFVCQKEWRWLTFEAHNILRDIWTPTMMMSRNTIANRRWAQRTPVSSEFPLLLLPSEARTHTIPYCFPRIDYQYLYHSLKWWYNLSRNLSTRLNLIHLITDKHA